jgi:hypothetical protein
LLAKNRAMFQASVNPSPAATRAAFSDKVRLMALAEDPQWCSADFPTWLMVRLSG